MQDICDRPLCAIEVAKTTGQTSLTVQQEIYGVVCGDTLPVMINMFAQQGLITANCCVLEHMAMG